jgi:hypothetical protein
MNAGGREQLDPGAPDPGSALDAYVDGVMPPAERAAFERRLAADPALAAGLAAQRRMDRSLRGLFVVPPFAGLPINGHPTPDPTSPVGNGMPLNGMPVTGAVKTAAAAVTKAAAPYNLILGGLMAVIVVCVSWLAYNALHDPRRSFEDVYHDASAARVSPGAASAESACGGMLGGLVTVKKLPAGVKIVGSGIEQVLSERTVVIRARVEGREVVLFADMASRVDQSSAKARVGKRADGLNVFMRQGNGMMIYEMTPFDKPKILGLLEFPPLALPECTNPPGR